MKQLLTALLLLAALVPACSAQSDVEELDALWNELNQTAANLEEEMYQAGVVFPEVTGQLNSIKRNLFLSRTLIDEGFYDDARSTLVQISASTAMLANDIENLKRNVVKPNDPLMFVMLAVVLAIIVMLFVILARARNNSYKTANA
jgi:hypothetical protein